MFTPGTSLAEAANTVFVRAKQTVLVPDSTSSK